METDQFVTEQILNQVGDNEFVHLCSTNREYYRICTSLDYWQRRYQEHGLLLLGTPATPREWIDDFRICQHIRMNVPMILQSFKTPINGRQMGYFVKVSRVEDFNLPEVDFDQIKGMYNSERTFKLDEIDVSWPFFLDDFRNNQNWKYKSFTITRGCIYYNNQNQTWIFSFASEEHDYSVPISEQSALTFLYVQIYRENMFFLGPVE